MIDLGQIPDLTDSLGLWFPKEINDCESNIRFKSILT